MAERRERAGKVVPAREAGATQPVEEVRRIGWPGLELELRHRRDPDGAGEYLALHLRAAPDVASWAALLRPWAALAAPWLLFTAPWLAAFTAFSALGHPALLAVRPEGDTKEA